MPKIRTRDMEQKIKALWSTLESSFSTEIIARKYKRLGLKKELGLRVALSNPDKQLEFLVEVEKKSKSEDFDFPTWHGMEFELLQMDVPTPGSVHVCLRLTSNELKDVFAVVCSDLAEELEAIKSKSVRKKVFLEFLEKWTRFFSTSGAGGLSKTVQQGLWGELHWLYRLLDSGVGKSEALHSWKGCERSYHDFDFSGKVVEVKTTKSKEPRKVWISNERQLNDNGLTSLHLLVLSVVESEGGGQTLPELVDLLRTELSSDALLARNFKSKLQSAGYLDIHESKYTANFMANTTELFKVTSNTPKITELPPGVGNLKYSVLVSKCSPDQVDEIKYLEKLK
jgi:hypothetical protein